MRWLLLFTLLLTTAASSAIAQPQPGINLAWDDCGASFSVGINKTSSCQSNTETTKALYGSYVLPSDVQALAGNDIVLDICTNSATLPCWWNFTVAPRNNAFQVQCNAPCPDNVGVGIFDYWATIPGGASVASAAQLMPTVATPRIRIVATGTVDANLAQPVSASVGEIYSFTLRLLHDATVGAGCTGCAIAAAIVLRTIRVTQVGFPSIELTSPSSRHYVFWQGGSVAPPFCHAVPTANKTWGALKALYR